MIIKNIEDKIKINKTIAFFAILGSIVIAIASLFFGFTSMQNANKTIYVLDGNIPLIASRTDINTNRKAESQAHVQLFHQKFFTLTPDDKFIESQVKEALYLIDESGLNEYVNLKERGFYNQLISSNSVMNIKTDSIKINEDLTEFKYYGKQIILRKTSQIIRNLQTEGKLRHIPRSENNSHGIILENWKVFDNTTISTSNRY